MESVLEKYIVRMLGSTGIFYASLLSQMVRIETKDIPTAGVAVKNGRITLYWNKEFLEKLKPEEAIAVLEHECMHLVMSHLLRLGERDHQLWNIAADLAINQLIENVPADCVHLNKFPVEWKLPKKSTAELYYNLIEKNSPSVTITPNADGKSYHVTIRDGKGKITGEFDTDKIGDHGKWTESDSQEVSREVIKKAVRQAKEQADASREHGHYPNELESYIEELLKPPVVSWQTLLRRFVAFSIKSGSKFTWKKPNRRYGEEQKGKLPSRQIAITVAVDTSGSISDKDLQDFIAEIRGIQACYNNTVTILECDAQVQKEYKLTRYSKVDTRFKGRGGTSFVPVFEWIKDKRIKTDVLIYFTDMYGDFPNTPPRYPVLWLSTTNTEKAPFGQVVSMPLHTQKKD